MHPQSYLIKLEANAAEHAELIHSSNARLRADDFFHDDAGAGQPFAIGCQVNLTWCSHFYEGSPQPGICELVTLSDGGSVAAWTFGL